MSAKKKKAKVWQAMKELMDHGAIKFPKLLPYQEQFLKMVESQAGIQKEMMKCPKEKTASEVQAMGLAKFLGLTPYPGMSPPAIGPHVIQNIQNFDQYTTAMAGKPTSSPDNMNQPDNEPASIGSMFNMMTQKPAPPIADPTTIALQRAGRIYIEAKARILRGDLAIETIISELEQAKADTEREILVVAIRDKAIENYDKMIAALSGGGAIQL